MPKVKDHDYNWLTKREKQNNKKMLKATIIFEAGFNFGLYSILTLNFDI